MRIDFMRIIHYSIVQVMIMPKRREKWKKKYLLMGGFLKIKRAHIDIMFIPQAGKGNHSIS